MSFALLASAAAPAWAVPASTPAADMTCAAPTVVAAWPTDGATLAPGDDLLAQVQGSCGSLQFFVSDAFAVEQPVVISPDGDLVRISPEPALVPGDYTLVSGYGEFVRTFTVADDAPAPEAPPAPTVALEAERSCASGALTTAMHAELDFGDAAPGLGVVRVSWRTEAGEAERDELLWTAAPTWSVDAIVFGGREACVVVDVYDGADALVASSDEVCAPPFDGCPASPRTTGDDEGRGCSTAGGAAAPLAALALAALAFRRRR